MALNSPIMNVMTAAARKAGRALNRDFGEVEQLQVSQKGPSDFVSAADKKAEKILLEELQKARPKYSFLLEEQGEIDGGDSSNRFIIDPLDGTTSFLHGIPHFCISIAHERDGQIQAGLVYEPTRDEMFCAERGQGAWLNDRRIRVAARKDLQECVLGTGIPHRGRGDHAEWLAIGAVMMSRVAGIRRFGAAALDMAYVAAGRFDGFWENHLHPWDVAAGSLLITEAGGMVTQMDGRSQHVQRGDILAANLDLHPKLLAIIKDVRAKRAARAQKTA